uniref:Reverse transcriptase domain-containing protein n=1 Tax=Nicotiana tabacum TaxID=4097 RepID=A0A1S4AU05_TOBAC|nr:PREDICTED: uncharacterized protein LOC107801414 [Nicotiana tabacum]
MLANSFVKGHTGSIKVETKKSDLFKVKQKDNEMLREFVSRFKMERIDLPPVADDWSVYPVITFDRVKRDIDREPRSNRDRYQSYNGDRRSSESGRNLMRNERRNYRGQNNRGLMSKNSFDRPVGPKEAPWLLEYNFNVDVAAIVSTIGHIKDTKWARPLQSDPAQSDPNLMCKYHGTHGHRTKDCRQLREEVARLFNDAHL